MPGISTSTASIRSRGRKWKVWLHSIRSPAHRSDRHWRGGAACARADRAEGHALRSVPAERPSGERRHGDRYSAERVDGEVTQSVAVKLLRPGGDDPHLRQRFLAERQILATLSHPKVARLLDAGHREDGQPYLVMEYVEGKPSMSTPQGSVFGRKSGCFSKCVPQSAICTVTWLCTAI